MRPYAFIATYANGDWRILLQSTFETEYVLFGHPWASYVLSRTATQKRAHSASS